MDPIAIVIPLTFTVIGPEVAPAGTLVAILVVVDELNVANVPLNATDGVVLKCVPVIVTGVPTAPPTGVKLVTVGDDNTVKLLALETVTPLTVTEILPVVATAGTLAVIVVVVDASTVAVVLLNFTMLLAGVVLKFVPVIVTIAPSAPLVAVNVLIVGEGNTIKFAALVIVTPLMVTEIFSVVAPTGTVVVILVLVDAVTIAVVLLNLTT